jgi:hypothetical protein
MLSSLMIKLLIKEKKRRTTTQICKKNPTTCLRKEKKGLCEYHSARLHAIHNIVTTLHLLQSHIFELMHVFRSSLMMYAGNEHVDPPDPSFRSRKECGP